MSEAEQQRVRQLLQERIAASGSMTTYARSIGVSNCHLWNVLAGRRGLGATVLQALGLQTTEPVKLEEPERFAPVVDLKPLPTYKPLFRLGDWPTFPKGA